MAAIAATRNTNHKPGTANKAFLAADSQTFYHGGMVMLDSAGLLRPASALAGNTGVVGVCQLDGAAHSSGSLASGTGGATWVTVKKGLFKFAGTTLTQAGLGLMHYAEDDQTLDETPIISEPLAGPLVELVSATVGWFYLGWDRIVQPIHGQYTSHVKLATLADADILTDWTPGFAGILTKIEAHVTDPATTGSKLSTLNAHVGAVAATGDLELTSANMTPLGAVVSQALTAGIFFGPASTISIVGSSTTTFIEGEATINLQYKQLSF